MSLSTGRGQLSNAFKILKAEWEATENLWRDIIRKEFAESIERNATHGSDAPETAAFEIVALHGNEFEPQLALYEAGGSYLDSKRSKRLLFREEVTLGGMPANRRMTYHFTQPGRQILHCTFGSVLTDPELRGVLEAHPSTYGDVWTDHFQRHDTGPGRRRARPASARRLPALRPRIQPHQLSVAERHAVPTGQERQCPWPR